MTLKRGELDFKEGRESRTPAIAAAAAAAAACTPTCGKPQHHGVLVDGACLSILSGGRL